VTPLVDVDQLRMRDVTVVTGLHLVRSDGQIKPARVWAGAAIDNDSAVGRSGKDTDRDGCGAGRDAIGDDPGDGDDDGERHSEPRSRWLPLELGGLCGLFGLCGLCNKSGRR